MGLSYCNKDFAEETKKKDRKYYYLSNLTVGAGNS